MAIPSSELILNPDGSIYHLNLKPEDIGDTIITVGDPDRVEKVTKYFDEILITTHKREFKTQTGLLNGKKITVISTGIGTDNIDIVINELDALVNIDFASREIKENITSLDIIRIGTSGAIQTDIPVDSFLISERAIGFDSLLQFYKSSHIQDFELQKQFVEFTDWNTNKSKPYIVNANDDLFKHFKNESIIGGFTATNVGFYGPQGRILRGKLDDPALNEKLLNFKSGEIKITNLEMETAGIYGLSQLLGHRAISLNAILANRALGTFSENPDYTVDTLIQLALDRVACL
ncbi:nucleoside phosphorylase [Leeuwenhoekiella sp. A16]|uniref:nucleoside phosphorylase n=1 Tax=unclassified Leeuwenhoekiella TaxID=2615029 RepID=UPI003A7FD620